MSLFVVNQFSNFASLATVAVVNAAVPSVLVVALALAAMRLQNWSAATRYCAWWLLLGFVVLLPLVLAVTHARSEARTESSAAPRHPIVTGSIMHPSLERSAGRHSLPLSARTPHPSWHLPRLAVLAPMLLLFWCAATLIQLFRIALGLFANARLKRTAVGVTDPALASLFSRLVALADVSRPVSLGISGAIAAPLAIGYRKPCVLLPADLVERLDQLETEQVLLHELAHIARYDDWAIAFQRVVEGLFSIHPLARFISRRLDLDREITCDDRVIGSSQPCTYATCLTKIAELTHTESNAALAMPLLSRKSHLVARVEIMLDRSRAHLPSLSVRHLLPFSAIGCITLLASVRAPVLLAAPVLRAAPAFQNASASPELPAPAAPVPPRAPAQPVTTPPAPPAPAIIIHRRASSPAKNNRYSTGSITVTDADGSASTFEENGNTWRDHSALPRNTIVFEQDGKSYIIRDTATIATAHALFARSEELSRQQESLGAQQAKLGEAQAKLGEQQAALAERHLDPATIKTLAKQVHDLEARLRSMDLQKNLGKVSEAQNRLGELQSLLGNMQSSLGEEQGKSGEAQGKLGEQQGELGERQGKLGEQQGKLGEQQAIEAQHIEKELRKLIQQSESRGLAQPLQ